MTDHIKVLGFAGSLRQASYNRALLSAAQEVAPQGMSLEIFDLTPIPLYNADVEKQGLPEAVRDFKERIAAADALLIATPEYNHSIPGLLKNAIDWASRPNNNSPLLGKPLAIMGAGGGSGTANAQRHLRQVAAHRRMPVLDAPVIMFAHAVDKFEVDTRARLVHEPSRARIRELLLALGDLVQIVREKTQVSAN